ncbi:hypothetical protein Tco_1113337 [Tanacetum coccineum]|uniref:CCHC-type domain-containing protein n=1 Tax=Tanacetum coccineum TaxID=301880 RepID=A0ABQ5IVM3_9ASTR
MERKIDEWSKSQNVSLEQTDRTEPPPPPQAHAGNSSACDPNLNSYNDSPNFFDYTPQPQYQTYYCELCGNNAHYGYDCPPQSPFHAKPEDIQELLHKLLKDLQIISEELSVFINCPSWNRPTFYDDDDEEYTIQYREYLENSSKAITPVLPIEEPDNSLSMGDEHLSTIPETESDEVMKSRVENLFPIPSESKGTSDDTCDVPFCDNSPPLDVLNDHFEIFSDFNNDCTLSDNNSFEDIDYVEASPPEDYLIMGNEKLSTIPEKESDEFIKSSVEDLVPIPSESEDISGSDNESVLPLCEDLSPINIFEEKSMTFSNPLFDSNDDFTSSDNESLSDEDISEDNVKIYSNPFFEFDEEYISSDVNPLFDEVLENIESKDSYVSNLDDPALLVTPLSDFNEDECFDPGGEIDEINEFLDMDISTEIEDGYHDSEGDILYLESLLNDNTTLSLPPKLFLDHAREV